MQEIMVRVERRELQGSAATQKTDYIELDRLSVISPYNYRGTDPNRWGANGVLMVL